MPRFRAFRQPPHIARVLLAAAAIVLGLATLACTGNQAVTPPTTDQASGTAAVPDDAADVPAYMIKGDPDAPVTFYEWSDYECPYCAMFAQEAGVRIHKEYVESGKIRMIFRDFPLTSMHANAQKASEAARCAGVLGGSDAYWGMHDALFGRQAEWVDAEDPAPALKKLAADFEVDQAKFDACLDNGEQTAAVEADIATGAAAGVGVTPTFIVNGNKIEGALPFETFKEQLDVIVAGGTLPTATVPPTVEMVEVDAPRIEVDIDGAPVAGEVDAPVTFIEFSDYECPYCAMFYNESNTVLKDEFVATGRVRHVFMDFPLTTLHPQAEAAAQAARCAGDQSPDAYWTMHDALFLYQADWSGSEDATSQFAKLADDAGLDGDALKTCVTSGTHAAAVAAAYEKALALGLGGTPSFVLNGQLVVGVLDAQMLRDAIERAERGESQKSFVPRGDADATATAEAATK